MISIIPILTQSGIIDYKSVPLWDKSVQWYNDGKNEGVEGADDNVVGVWDQGIGGKDIHINVIDEHGFQTEHVAFQGRFNLNYSFNFQDDTANPNLPYYHWQWCHADACMGMAAGGVNNFGTLGVAPFATVSGIVVNNSWTTIHDYINWYHLYSHHYDVRSISIGYSVGHKGKKYYYRRVRENDALFRNQARTARNGSGLIIIQAAGNSGYDGLTNNHGGFQSARQMLNIAASGPRGDHVLYTSIGPNLGINTISLWNGDMGSPNYYLPTAGCNGNEEYIWTFSGTSAAAPQAAGVAALLLDVNPKLGWRDVQAILMLTATKNNPLSSTWQTNAAGIKYSPLFGFGRVDATLAVETAKKWVNLPDEISIKGRSNDRKPISTVRQDPTIIKVRVDGELNHTEFVNLRFRTKRMNNLDGMSIYLTSPSGTRIQMLYPKINNDEGAVSLEMETVIDYEYQLGARAFYGECAKGIWTVEFKYDVYYLNDEVYDVVVKCYGHNGDLMIPNNLRNASTVRTILDDGVEDGKISIELSNESLKCGDNFEITIKTNPETEDSVFVFAIKDGVPNLLSSLVKTNVKTKLTAPCSFEDNTSFEIATAFPASKSIARKTILVENKGIGFDFPKPYSKIGSESEVFEARWRWQMKDFRPMPYMQKAILSIYSLDRDETVYNAIVDNFELVSINASELPDEKFILSVSQVFNQTDPCHSFIVPISKSGNKYLVPIDTMRCGKIDGVDTEQGISSSLFYIILGSILGVIAIVAIVAVVLHYRTKNARSKLGDSTKLITTSEI